ncbi:MAG: hypothetical protein P8R42_16970 [Candidatus Binatia bacterium]|nr:hypothetical protein [Candidatus Binatia bacterium]
MFVDPVRRKSTLAALALAAITCQAPTTDPNAAPDAGPAATQVPVEAVDFEKHERQVFSQFGEDGVIEKIFEIIEPTEKYAVEFGAHNGVAASNVRNLIVNHGWGSFQIEGSEPLARQLRKNYLDYPKVKTQQAWVWPGNVEILFEEAGVPKDLDLLVIDIDSNDYYVWRALHDFRPKVVMVEINAGFPPPQLMVIDFHPMNYWDGRDYAGASLQSYHELAKRKGYELVYHMSSGVNALFVDAKYYPLFGIEDNSPTKLFRPATEWAEMFDTSPQGRDGVPFDEDNRYLTWKDLKIEKKFIFTR